MILTGPAIKSAVKDGDVSLVPFDESNLNPNSYNYHLAGSLLLLGHGGKPARKVTLPAEGYVLRPGKVYLAATLERIGSDRYVTLLLGRSSIGRLGIFLNVTADLGHLGSCSHWTLELTVVQPVRIYPRMFLKPFDGTGNTSMGNSAELIDKATAVLVLASVEYLTRAKDKSSHIGIEVERMKARSNEIPVVVLGLDARTKLETVPGSDWGDFNAGWTGQKVVIADIPLRDASDFQISDALSHVLTAIKSWKP